MDFAVVFVFLAGDLTHENAKYASVGAFKILCLMSPRTFTISSGIRLSVISFYPTGQTVLLSWATHSVR